MINRTLQRPMFRIGGSAGTGITTGLRRQGYNTGLSVKPADFPGSQEEWEAQQKILIEKGIIDSQGNRTGGKKITVNEENTGNNNTGGSIKDTNETEIIPSFVSELDKSNPYPESKPYPYKASDFFMGLGANILAQPGGQPIFQTIGKAAGPALDQLRKTQQGDWALKQQDKLGKWKSDRELLLTAWKNMDKEKKTSMMRDAEYYVKQGVFPDVGTALEAMLFRKDKRPDVYKRDWVDTRSEEIRKSGDYDDQTVAKIIAEFEWDYNSGKYSDWKDKMDTEQKIIEPVRRTYSPDGKSFTLTDTTELDTYNPGSIYFNLDDKQWYTFNGTNFTLYEDETEELKVE